jgi:hypothetical protein
VCKADNVATICEPFYRQYEILSTLLTPHASAQFAINTSTGCALKESAVLLCYDPNCLGLFSACVVPLTCTCPLYGFVALLISPFFFRCVAVFNAFIFLANPV